MSAHINDAFKVLSNPITRAEYILTLNGSPCSSKDVPVDDMRFLLEVMELNEQVDAIASCIAQKNDVSMLSKTVGDIYDHTVARWDQEIATVVKCLEEKKWDSSHEALSRARYFERLKGRLRDLKPQLAVRGVNVSFD